MQLNYFNVIKRVLLSSKSQSLMKKLGQVCFEVDKNANKSEIKKAVEALWKGVKVSKVSTMNVPGRTKMLRRGLSVTLGAHKKAIVTVKNVEELESSLQNSSGSVN